MGCSVEAIGGAPRAMRSLLLAALAALALAGCTTQEALTAKATDCTRLDLTILPSKFRDQGLTTAWCAVCKGQRYRCVGSADRTRVECRPLRPDDIC
jgi:hypothetical protein